MDHQYTAVTEGYELSETIDLGHDVTMQYLRRDGVVDGIYWEHGCNFGNTPIEFDLPSNAHVPTVGKWQLENLEPLTLSPSLLCQCGVHGFIRNGRWEPV